MMETSYPFTVLLTNDEIEHLDVVMRTKVGRILDMRTQEGEIINKILMQVYDKVREGGR
jgi:16S rRNA U1498 N3-methylase RsmE